MCGVFGFIGHKHQNPQRETLARIARVTARRGPHAWGLAWIDSRGRMHAYKQPGNICDALDTLAELTADAVVLIGHTRYATQGNPAENVNNHPHACDGGWIVHNGIVDNYSELVTSHNLRPVSECDSETIALLVESDSGKTYAERLTNSLYEVESRALVVLGLWKPGLLVAARRGNPLHGCETSRGVYLASLPHEMPGTVFEVANNSVVSFSANERAKVHGKILSLGNATADAEQGRYSETHR